MNQTKVMVEQFGADAVPQLTGANIPFVIRLRVVLLRDTGAPLSSFQCLANHSRFRNSWDLE